MEITQIMIAMLMAGHTQAQLIGFVRDMPIPGKNYVIQKMSIPNAFLLLLRDLNILKMPRNLIHIGGKIDLQNKERDDGLVDYRFGVPSVCAKSY
ncbi:3878_t:CDS:2, partial [Dentiscutata heterogama]